MAVIPTRTGPSVSSSGLPAPQVRAQQADTGLLDLGQQVANAGLQVWAKEKEKADNAALIEAEAELSKWKTDRMFNAENGVYSRKGYNALDVTNQTMPEFDKKVEEIGGRLNDSRQQERWKQLTTRQRSQFDAELNRYEFGERQSYYDQVDVTSLEAASSAAVSYYNDPQQVAYYQNKGAAVLAASGQRKGLPPETVAANVTKYNSAISLGVIDRIASTDPLKAQQYYAGAMGYMTPEDQAKASAGLAAGVARVVGESFADSMWNTGALNNDLLVHLVVQAESGGKVDAVSPKGAKGLMQLMPDTARDVAKSLGVAFDEGRLLTDPNYNMALGTAYLNQLRERYNDNTVLALAAYNGGMGNVDKWIAKYGDPRKGEISMAEFVEKIPFDETRNYVTKIMGQMGGAGGRARNKADAMRAIASISDERTRNAAESRLADLEKVQAAEENALYESAADFVRSGGINAVPNSMMATLSADDYSKLLRLNKQLREGVPITTDLGKFEELLALPASRLAELSLERDIRPYLSDQDFDRMTTAWTKAKQGDSSALSALAGNNKLVNEYMAQAGILTGTSESAMTKGNIEKQHQFLASLEQSKEQWSIANDGKEPTGSALREILQDQLLEVRLAGTGYFGTSIGATSAINWQADPALDTYVDYDDLEVPALERGEIISEIRRNGGSAEPKLVKELYAKRLKMRGVHIRGL